MLQALLKGGGSLTKRDLKSYYPGNSAPKQLNPSVTRLRILLSSALGVERTVKLLPYDNNNHCWRLEVVIGHAEKIDPEYVGGNPRLTLIPCGS